MTDPHAHSSRHEPASVFSGHPVLTGAAVGVVSLAPHFFLTVEASLAFAAILISLIAGIYFGFAVVNGSQREQLIEFSVAGAFAIAGLVGFLVWPILLPLAYFAHAAWDAAHHNRAKLSLVSIPQWYVPWCVVIDVIVGAGLVVLWLNKGIL